MGQVYSITAQMKFKDSHLAVEKAIEFLDEHNIQHDFCDVEGMMRFFFTEDVEKGVDGTYIADFNASYGWEGLIYGMFHSIACALENGSYLDVYPDTGETTLQISNGVVGVTTYG